MFQGGQTRPMASPSSSTSRSSTTRDRSKWRSYLTLDEPGAPMDQADVNMEQAHSTKEEILQQIKESLSKKQYDVPRQMLKKAQELQLTKGDVTELLKVTLQAVDGSQWKNNQDTDFVVGTKKICQILIAMGARPKYKEIENVMNHHRGKFETIKLLISAAKLTKKEKGELLSTAIYTERLKICRLLLDRGTKVRRHHIRSAFLSYADQKYLDLLEGPANISKYSKKTLYQMLLDHTDPEIGEGLNATAVRCLIKHGARIKYRHLRWISRSADKDLKNAFKNSTHQMDLSRNQELALLMRAVQNNDPIMYSVLVHERGVNLNASGHLDMPLWMATFLSN